MMLVWYGFWWQRSTTSLLLSAVDDWAKTSNPGHYVPCLFLDFSKAFDSVSIVPKLCMG